MQDINKFTKVEAGLIHFLPFKPSVKREKSFSVDRIHGKKVMSIRALESLNVVDFIVFIQMINDYGQDSLKWVYGGNIEGRNLTKRTLDLAHITKERIGNSHKRNREVTAKCLERISNIKVTIKEEQLTIHTWYIHQIKIANDFSSAEVVVNEAFLLKCIKNGLVFDFGRLLDYGKNYYAVLLDSYLQGTKERERIKGKIKRNGKLFYRHMYEEEVIFNILFLDSTNMRYSDKHKIIKESFDTLHTIGKLPVYEFNKYEKKWERVKAKSSKGNVS